MQEQLGRLMLSSPIGVWDAPVSQRDIEREATALLKQVPLFSGLSRRHLASVASVAAPKHYLAGAALVHVGAPADAFYVILDGDARVDIPGGAVVSSGRLLRGDGSLSTASRAPRPSPWSPTSSCSQSLAEVLALLVAEPKVALAMMTTLVRRLRAAQAAKPVAEKRRRQARRGPGRNLGGWTSPRGAPGAPPMAQPCRLGCEAHAARPGKTGDLGKVPLYACGRRRVVPHRCPAARLLPSGGSKRLGATLASVGSRVATSAARYARERCAGSTVPTLAVAVVLVAASPLAARDRDTGAWRTWRMTRGVVDVVGPRSDGRFVVGCARTALPAAAGQRAPPAVSVERRSVHG